MKNTVLLVMLFVNASFGQVSILSFYSVSFEKQESDLKKRIGSGFGLSYDVTKVIGVGLQVRDGELWRLNSKIEEVVTLKSFTGQFYVHGTNAKESKWGGVPVAGVLAGIVAPIDDPENKRDFLKNPIVFGVFGESHFSRKLSKKFYAGIFFKLEGEFGILRNREMLNENISTAGFLSGGFRLNYNFME